MLEQIKARFFENMDRHPSLDWADVEARLRAHPAALEALQKMEDSGGEPDTIGFSEDGKALIFCDCAKETTKNPPKGSAEAQSKEIGISLLTEELYYRLQTLGTFDLKTSSWIATPAEIRAKGGALFCERRYGRVFTFHNGADSYYSVRGWRGYFCV